MIVDDRFDDPRAIAGHVEHGFVGQRVRFLSQQFVQRPCIQFHRIIQVCSIDGHKLFETKVNIMKLAI